MAVEVDGMTELLQPYRIEWVDSEADITHAGYAVRSSLLTARLTFPDVANPDDVFYWMTFDDNQEHTVKLPTFQFPFSYDETEYESCFVNVIQPNYQYLSLYSFVVEIRKVPIVDFYDGGDLLVDEDSAFLLDGDSNILFGGWG